MIYMIEFYRYRSYMWLSIMYLIGFQQHVAHARRFRVVAAFSRIEAAHPRHVFIGQGKIEDGDIIGHVLGIGRLRQDDEAFLYFEAQDDLAGCLIVFMGQGRDEGMGEKGFVAVA